MVMPGAQGDAPILKPSVMTAVPVILDRIYKGINAKISASGPFKSKLVDFCIRYRASWLRRGYDTPIINRLVFGPMKAIVGGKVKLLLCGGAPLADEAHQFIRTALCCKLHQGKLVVFYSTLMGQ
jgi:long-chain acyl-CoA synthetase